MATILTEVDDEAQACVADSGLIKSTAVQTAIANFYNAVFLCYGDMIKYYKSSSRRKVLHSVNDKFMDQFKGPLDNIKRLSALVRRAASHGQGAELRVTRLETEALRVDMRVGLEGVARKLAEMQRAQDQLKHEQERQTANLERMTNPQVAKALTDELWRKIGINGVAFLLDRKHSFADEQKDIASIGFQNQSRITINDKHTALSGVGQGYDGQEQSVTINDIIPSLEGLLEFVSNGKRAMDRTEQVFLAFDERIAIALEKWTRAEASMLLYLEAAVMNTSLNKPEVTVAAGQIVNSAQQLELPILSFFCSATDFVISSPETMSVSPLQGLVYSLIYQLAEQLPPLTDLSMLLQPSILTALENPPLNWDLALELFTQLLVLGPPLLFCVIDSFHLIESRSGGDTNTRMQTHQLLGVLRVAMEAKGKTLKVLFVAPVRAFSLLEEIPSEERQMIEWGRRAAGGVSAGRRAFLPSMS